jgi:glycosyltransferase involved in cell wall biosynthesis
VKIHSARLGLNGILYMKNNKKVVLFHSDYCGAPTGFGGFMREIMTYLYKTGKYEIVLYSCGSHWDNNEYTKWPWKVYGSIPNDEREIQSWLSRFPEHERQVRARDMQYGSLNIDRVIQEVKPDVYIGNQDFWGLSYCLDKKWWNKIPCVLNWTADSIPILEEAQEKAHLIKHHRVWADFAVKAYKQLAIDEAVKFKQFEEKILSAQYPSPEHKEGALKHAALVKKRCQEKIEAFNRVELLRGTVDTKTFRRLDNDEKLSLRAKLNLNKDDFYLGFLSRNQLRKLIPNLLEGYKAFKEQNPNIKNTKLLLFTHWGEGWNIPRLLNELNISNDEVLACYKCRKTGDFFVMPFIGQDIDNPRIQDKKTLVTVNLGDSLTTEQVNQWYNLLDGFILPITSGGQERALQEAKMCELITITNPYSCGEDNCVPEAQSILLEQSFNREFGSQFIKASPLPQSIADSIKYLYELVNNQPEKAVEMGKKARQWVLDNFSIEVIGKKYEELIDSMPIHDWDFNMDFEVKDPNSQIPNNQDDKEWLKLMYKNILKMDVDDFDSGLTYWCEELKKGGTRQKIEEYFRGVAIQENQKNIQVKLEDLLDNSGRKRVGVVMPESAGDVFLCTSLLKSLRNRYPKSDWALHFITKPEFFEILDLNRDIDKLVPYSQEFDNLILMEGSGNHNGYFNVLYPLHFGTQRILSWLHNGVDKHDVELNNTETQIACNNGV